MLKDKVLLITGGTGSFGHAVLEYFLRSDCAEIRIFSRDEKKQEEKKKDEKKRDPHPEQDRQEKRAKRNRKDRKKGRMLPTESNKHVLWRLPRKKVQTAWRSV